MLFFQKILLKLSIRAFNLSPSLAARTSVLKEAKRTDKLEGTILFVKKLALPNKDNWILLLGTVQLSVSLATRTSGPPEEGGRPEGSQNAQTHLSKHPLLFLQQ